MTKHEMILLLHYLSEWNERRNIEAAMGWSHISHRYLIENPRLIDTRPKPKLMKDSPLGGWLCSLDLLLPDAKKYTMSIDTADNWTRTKTGWIPERLMRLHPKMRYRVAYPTGIEPEENKLFISSVYGNGYYAEETLYSPPFVATGRYESNITGTSMWFWDWDGDSYHYSYDQ